MAKRASPTVIGSFVLGAIVLAIVGLAVFGSGRFFRRTHEYVAFFDGSLNGLNPGAPVKFRGVQVGNVEQVLLGLQGEGIRADVVRLPVIVVLDLDLIQTSGSRFRPERFEELVTQGLRARLAAESLVTGVLYVALDILPDTPIERYLPKDSDWEEIPTVPTRLEELQSAARQMLSKLEEIDVKGLVDAAKAAVHTVDETLKSPGLQEGLAHLGETIARLNAAIESVEALVGDVRKEAVPLTESLRASSDHAAATLSAATETLGRIDALLAPESPLSYQISTVMQDLAAAARAIRNLADYLERNPGAIVRGKSVPGDQP